MELKFRSDLKDFEIARLMDWVSLDDKRPISKSNFEFIKRARKHGFIVYCCPTVCLVGLPVKIAYPEPYTHKMYEENDWMGTFICSEVLELPENFIEENNFEKYRDGIPK